MRDHNHERGALIVYEDDGVAWDWSHSTGTVLVPVNGGLPLSTETVTFRVFDLNQIVSITIGTLKAGWP